MKQEQKIKIVREVFEFKNFDHEFNIEFKNDKIYFRTTNKLPYLKYLALAVGEYNVEVHSLGSESWVGDYETEEEFKDLIKKAKTIYRIKENEASQSYLENEESLNKIEETVLETLKDWGKQFYTKRTEDAILISFDGSEFVIKITYEDIEVKEEEDFEHYTRFQSERELHNELYDLLRNF